MRVLLLAPEPLYQARGTPIAVDLLIGALSERGDTIDLVTFPEGEDVRYEGLAIYRCRPVPPVHGIRPGFSLGKLVCDLALWRTARRLMRAHRYDVVHAVEESAFIARRLCRGTGVPFVYDMDSSMSDQLAHAKPWLRPFLPVMRAIEKGPMRAAEVVVPMCDALADIARRAGARHVHVLKDVSLVGDDTGGAEDVRQTLGIQAPIVMYVGNLERYQGIDLLLESFTRVVRGGFAAALVIVGGSPGDVARYAAKARRLGVGEQVHLIGPRPLTALGGFLRQADILASPRITGTNTPMKFYSYLDSGVPVLATDLPTHTQVATPEVAELAAPEPEAFAAAMHQLLSDPARGAALARRAAELIRREHSREAFRRSAHALYEHLERTAGEMRGAVRAG